MKRLILLCALLSSGTAQAQIPVTDAVGIAGRAIEHALTLQEWIKQIKEMKKQWKQMNQTHTALTGVRNLGEVFDDPELRQYLPDDWQDLYRALKYSGYEGLLGKGIEIYEANQIFDGCDHIEQLEMQIDCQARAVSPSQNQGYASEALELVTTRGAQLKSLQEQINTTEDPKAIAELQARISIEQAAIANEATRLNLARSVADSERLILQQRQKEYQARNWSATKGIEVDAVIFED